MLVDSSNVVHYAYWTTEASHTVTIGATSMTLTDTVQVIESANASDIFIESDYPDYAGKKRLVGYPSTNFSERFNSPFNTATGAYSHVEGDHTNSEGICAHVEGRYNDGNGLCTHSEGEHNTSDLDYAHTEGNNNIAGSSCHSDGSFNIAYGGDIYIVTAFDSVNKTLTLDTVTGLSVNNVVIVKREYQIYLKATILAINGFVVTIDLVPTSTYTCLIKPVSGRGVASTSGANNLACGSNSRVSGSGSIASASHAFAHGIGLWAKGVYQAVFGKYNVVDAANLFVIGNGTSATARSNALSVDALGNLVVGGTTLRISSTKTPASATDTGSAGMLAWDANYIYVCTATDTWKRMAITTW